MENTTDWKPRYYLALIKTAHDNKSVALQLLADIQTPISFAPFYVTRARLRDSSNVEQIVNDYNTALKLDTKDWRYAKYLTEYLVSQKQYAKALTTIEPYYKKDKSNYITGMLYARCLMLNNQYTAAEKILDNIYILPFEGATNGHKVYEQIKLIRALELLQKRNYTTALQKVAEAREWPERLGVGKPYPDMLNDTLPNDIEKLIQQTKQGEKIPDNSISIYMDKIKTGG